MSLLDMKYMIANYVLNSAITLSYIPNLGKICIFPAVSISMWNYIISTTNKFITRNEGIFGYKTFSNIFMTIFVNYINHRHV